MFSGDDESPGKFVLFDERLLRSPEEHSSDQNNNLSKQNHWTVSPIPEEAKLPTEVTYSPKRLRLIVVIDFSYDFLV